MLEHRRTGKDTGDKKRCWIEGIVKSKLQFLAPGQRLELQRTLIGAVIWNDPQNVMLAVFTLAGVLPATVLAGLTLRLGSVGQGL